MKTPTLWEHPDLLQKKDLSDLDVSYAKQSFRNKMGHITIYAPPTEDEIVTDYNQYTTLLPPGW